MLLDFWYESCHRFMTMMSVVYSNVVCLVVRDNYVAHSAFEHFPNTYRYAFQILVIALPPAVRKSLYRKSLPTSLGKCKYPRAVKLAPRAGE